MEYMGFPVQVLRMVEAHVSNIVFFVEIDGNCSERIETTNGFGQGCSFSVIVTAAFMKVWTR